MVEAMDLVNKEDVALLEVREYGGEVSRAGDRGTGAGLETGTHLIGDHACKGRLPEAGRS